MEHAVAQARHREEFQLRLDRAAITGVNSRRRAPQSQPVRSTRFSSKISQQQAATQHGYNSSGYKDNGSDPHELKASQLTKTRRSSNPEDRTNPDEAIFDQTTELFSLSKASYAQHAPPTPTHTSVHAGHGTGHGGAHGTGHGGGPQTPPTSGAVSPPGPNTSPTKQAPHTNDQNTHSPSARARSPDRLTSRRASEPPTYLSSYVAQSDIFGAWRSQSTNSGSRSAPSSTHGKRSKERYPEHEQIPENMEEKIDFDGSYKNNFDEGYGKSENFAFTQYNPEMANQEAEFEGYDERIEVMRSVEGDNSWQDYEDQKQYQDTARYEQRENHNIVRSGTPFQKTPSPPQSPRDQFDMYSREQEIDEYKQGLQYSPRQQGGVPPQDQSRGVIGSERRGYNSPYNSPPASNAQYSNGTGQAMAQQTAASGAGGTVSGGGLQSQEAVAMAAQGHLVDERVYQDEAHQHYQSQRNGWYPAQQHHNVDMARQESVGRHHQPHAYGGQPRTSAAGYGQHMPHHVSPDRVVDTVSYVDGTRIHRPARQQVRYIVDGSGHVPYQAQEVLLPRSAKYPNGTYLLYPTQPSVIVDPNEFAFVQENGFEQHQVEYATVAPTSPQVAYIDHNARIQRRAPSTPTATTTTTTTAPAATTTAAAPASTRQNAVLSKETMDVKDQEFIRSDMEQLSAGMQQLTVIPASGGFHVVQTDPNSGKKTISPDFLVSANRMDRSIHSLNNRPEGLLVQHNGEILLLQPPVAERDVHVAAKPELPPIPLNQLPQKKDGTQWVAPIEISQLHQNIVSLAKSQYGSRLLQDFVMQDHAEITELIFEEIKTVLPDLMVDLFGNYLCQQVLQKISEPQMTFTIQELAKDMISIAYDRQGTRALQRLIEYAHTDTQRQMIIKAFNIPDQVLKLMFDSHGCYVITAMLENMPIIDVKFIFDVAVEHCEKLASDQHGLCVLKKCVSLTSPNEKLPKNIIQRTSDEGSEMDTRTKEHNRLAERILHYAGVFVNNQFGNYLIQNLLDVATVDCMEKLHQKFRDHYCEYSGQKFSSNVVEKFLRKATEGIKEDIISEIINAPDFFTLLQDSFGNYVIQNALQNASKTQAYLLMDKIGPYTGNLTKNNVQRKWERLLENTRNKFDPTHKKLEAKKQRKQQETAAVAALVAKGHTPTGALCMGHDASPIQTTATTTTAGPPHATSVAPAVMAHANGWQTNGAMSSVRHGAVQLHNPAAVPAMNQMNLRRNAFEEPTTATDYNSYSVTKQGSQSFVRQSSNPQFRLREQSELRGLQHNVNISVTREGQAIHQTQVHSPQFSHQDATTQYTTATAPSTIHSVASAEYHPQNVHQTAGVGGPQHHHQSSGVGGPQHQIDDNTASMHHQFSNAQGQQSGMQSQSQTQQVTHSAQQKSRNGRKKRRNGRKHNQGT